MSKSIDEHAERRLKDQLDAHPVRKLGQAGEVVLLYKHIGLSLFLVGMFLLLSRDSFLEVSMLYSMDIPGETTGFEETNIYEDDEPVWKVFFTYTVDGKTYDGYCYHAYPPEGAATIVVSRINHGLAKIRGSEYSALGYFGLMFFGLPLLGCLIWLVYRLKVFRGLHRLLIDGEAVFAQLERSKKTENPKIWHKTYGLDHPDANTELTLNMQTEESPAQALALVRKAVTPRLWASLPYPMTLGQDGNWEAPEPSLVIRSVLIFLLGSLLVGAGLYRFLSVLFGF